MITVRSCEDTSMQGSWAFTLIWCERCQTNCPRETLQLVTQPQRVDRSGNTCRVVYLIVIIWQLLRRLAQEIYSVIAWKLKSHWVARIYFQKSVAESFPLLRSDDGYCARPLNFQNLHTLAYYCIKSRRDKSQYSKVTWKVSVIIGQLLGPKLQNEIYCPYFSRTVCNYV